MMWIPVYRSWRLNERHYGTLQGLNKSKTAFKHGERQLFLWRRSYDEKPQALKKTDERNPELYLKYKNLSTKQLPSTECLKDTVIRFLHYCHETIAPAIVSGSKVLIVAHSNSLQALLKHPDNLSYKAIVKLNVLTGIPLMYELDKNLKPVKNYYL